MLINIGAVIYAKTNTFWSFMIESNGYFKHSNWIVCGEQHNRESKKNQKFHVKKIKKFRISISMSTL